MKVEKVRKEQKFLIIIFKLKIKGEISEEKKYEYFSDKKYKFYYTVEKEGEELFESEVFTDDGKFNIIQIPIIYLEPDFDISFYKDGKKQFGKIHTNINEITAHNNDKFFMHRLSMNHYIIIYNYSFISEEISFLDYIINEEIRIGLNFGIDFTITNKPPNEKDSLHCITNEKIKNPYERAILKCGNIIGCYDYDQKFPVYGFGAVVNSKTSQCFNINFKDDPNIETVDNIIKYYHQCVNKITFSGPTFFAPIINKVINDIKIQNDPKEYQILMILTDGVIQDTENTIDSLVEGSFYPLSIIIIGIGDRDFSKMVKLDGDEIPLISSKGIKRQRDLVQFVPFNKYEGDEAKLAYEVLEEIPRQIIEYYTLNPEIFIDGSQIMSKCNNLKNFYLITNSENGNRNPPKDELFNYNSFKLFDKTNKIIESYKTIDKKNHYYNVIEMFNIFEKKKNKIKTIKKSQTSRIFNIYNNNINFH